MRIALLQMQSGIDPFANAEALASGIRTAADAGARILFTPEMSGLLDRDRARSAKHVHVEAADPVLARVREEAANASIWVELGSLGILGEADDRRVNRSFLIDDQGEIRARYDKIHLFDVDLPTGESWRESSAYRPGEKAVVADTPCGRLGMTVCYDLRFPALFAALSAAGANILSIPAAFTVPTGKAHWHALMRARAIENACWVVAAAQAGQHEDGRATFGHSLVIDPWGEVVLDMGEQPGLGFADIDPDQCRVVKERVPVIEHRRAIPEVIVFS